MDELRKKRFIETLTSAYDHQTYILFLKELLNDVQIVNPNHLIQPYNTFSVAISGYYHIGNFSGKNGNKVALFSVELKNNKNLENARSMQRNFVKNLLEESGFQGALVVFYTKDAPDKWRLSLVRLDYELLQGKISKKLTPAKRYSFLVGEGEPCHTAQQQLLPIFENEDQNPSLDDLEAAFSVEAVTDDFFNQYKEKYLQLKEVLDRNESFNAEAESRGFTSEQFAKKLMGQIVFLYFVQKKGWLGVGAFPAELTDTEYKNAFYSRGQKPKQLMPLVYFLSDDGKYHRNGKAIMAMPAEDQVELSKIVKGNPWGSGPKDFMRQLFIIAEERNKNYFDDFLEPLFYTGLNENRGENAYFAPLNCRIPFLNGGLFEQLDGYEWAHNDFEIPNEIFSNAESKGRDADGILDIFDRYNFTIAEDEPMEREIAIDPEMLGKVFENLLDVKDRKSKGAFYTPREIVHFMCQETLINFLTNKSGIPEEDIRKFILYGEYFCDEDTKKTKFIAGENGDKGHFEYDNQRQLEIPETILSFQKNVNRLKELDELLDNVKVADLAVGSGAFPLGMLNEIVKARSTITSYLAIDMNKFDRGLLYADRSPYRLKRAAIKNSIFACDIEPSATDITKLRLWLSLVIDDQIMDHKNEERGYDTKPRELPNLDCNIICGNSLMDEFGGIQLLTENAALKNESKNRQLNFLDSKLSVQIQKLINLQSKLYDEKAHVEKDILNEEIKDIYNKIILEQIQGNSELVNEYFKTVNQPSKPFVLWQLYFPKVFRDNGGFDIVIGNPPYVSAVTSGSDDIAFRDYLRRRFPELKGAFDLYVPFMLLGVRLTADYGSFSWIIPNKFLVAEYADKALKKMKNCGLNRVVNVSEINVFHNVGVYPIIVEGQKKSNKNYEEVIATSLDQLSKREFDKKDTIADYPTIAEKGIKLSSGATGFQAQQLINYIVEEGTANSIPFIVSGSVDRYNYSNDTVRYMKKVYHKPYVFQGEAVADSKWKFWNSPKIVIAGMTKVIEAVYIEKPMALGVGIYGIYNFANYNPKALTAILNSKIMTYFMVTLFKEKHLAGGYLAINKNTIEKLPMVDVDNVTQKRLAELYDDISASIFYGGDSSEEEREVDNIVSDLYKIDINRI